MLTPHSAGGEHTWELGPLCRRHCPGHASEEPQGHGSELGVMGLGDSSTAWAGLDLH